MAQTKCAGAAALLLTLSGAEAFNVPVSSVTRASLASRSSAAPCYGLKRTSTSMVVEQVRTADTISVPDEQVQPNKIGELSYSQLYDKVYASKPLVINKPTVKPNFVAQQLDPKAKKVPFSDVYGVAKRSLFGRKWTGKDIGYATFFAFLHGLCLLAPFTFTWNRFAAFFATYFVTGCMGVTFSYHRQLAHRSFTTPKWLEYFMAYCGAMSVQGDPIEWVSNHRYHHLHTDTPLDPHSPYESFWWSHMGWMLDETATEERCHSRTNSLDLNKQPFYKHLEKWYGLHITAKYVLCLALGGLPGLIWAGALPTVFLWHVTWFVNSASHVWGKQTYKTGDLSRNNWWVGILAFGEGWHNNHHAFEFSAQHGMGERQFDITWEMVKVLRALKLAKNVKLPTEAQKARLAF